jgi:hypothetical protein
MKFKVGDRILEILPGDAFRSRMDFGGMDLVFDPGEVTKLYPAEGEPEYDEWEFAKCTRCGVHLTPDEGPTVYRAVNVRRPAPGISISQFENYHERCRPPGDGFRKWDGEKEVEA